MIYLLLIIILGFFLRLLFILSESSDDDTHLWYVNRYTKMKFGSHRVDNTLIEGSKGYPTLPHYIISRFPKKHWVLAGKLLNIIYDCLSLVLIYFLSYILFQKIWEFETDDVVSPEIATTLLSATSPILFPVTARLRAMGGRVVGNLLNLLYFVSFGYAFLFSQPLFYLPCFVVGLLIILSSQFGLQNWLFTSAVLSIFYLHPIPLIFAIATVIIGAITPGLGIKQILRHKYNHYLWYFRLTEGVGIEDRNNLKDIVFLPAYLVKDLRKFIHLIFTKITPIIAAYSMPVLVILIFWFAKSPQKLIALADEKIIFYLLALSSASCLAFVITSLKPFLFLGEAERYLEYSAFYINLLFVYLLLEQGIESSIVFWLVVIQLCIIFVNYFFVIKGELLKALGIGTALPFKALIDFLQQQENLKILCIPTKISFRIATELDHPNTLFYYNFVTKDIDGFQYMKDDMVAYRFVRPDFSYFRQKYAINTLVVKKSDLTIAQKQGINYNFEALNKIFENDEYMVYTIA